MKTNTEIKTSGYLWRVGGFANTHIWALHIVGGIIIAVGTVFITIASLHVMTLPHWLFWRFIAIGACAFLLCIAMALGSIASLLFFLGAKKLSLLEPDGTILEAKNEERRT